jgi:hypothetical protein
MSPAVGPGLDLAELVGPVRDDAVADLAGAGPDRPQDPRARYTPIGVADDFGYLAVEICEVFVQEMVRRRQVWKPTTSIRLLEPM